MKRLRLVERSRVDGGVQLQILHARMQLHAIEEGRCPDNAEALERLARAIAYLTTAERYIKDPKGVWA